MAQFCVLLSAFVLGANCLIISVAHAEEFCWCRHVGICPGIVLKGHVGVGSGGRRRPLQNTISIPIENQSVTGQLRPQDLNERDARQSVIIARGNSDGDRHVRRDRRLAKRIVAPNHAVSIGTELGAVEIARGDDHDVGQIRGWRTGRQPKIPIISSVLHQPLDMIHSEMPKGRALKIFPLHWFFSASASWVMALQPGNSGTSTT